MKPSPTLLLLLTLGSALSLTAAGCGILTETFPGSNDPEPGENNSPVNNNANNANNNPVNNANNNPANNVNNNPTNNVNNNPNNNTNNNTGNNNNTINNNTPATPTLVLLEDQSLIQPEDIAPGADIDAIELQPLDGAPLFAAQVWDSALLGEANAFTDSSAVLGPPDAGCEAAGFASLGGSGYVIVSFGAEGEVQPQLIPGSTLVIHEVGLEGEEPCPEAAPWIGEEVLVEVSVGDERGSFTVLGTVGAGSNALIVR